MTSALSLAKANKINHNYSAQFPKGVVYRLALSRANHHRHLFLSPKATLKNLPCADFQLMGFPSGVTCFY